MSKDKISEYSSTAASNTDIGSININEGCAPSNINNAIRELMAQIKNFQQGADGDGLTVSTLNATTATVGSLSASSFGAITATSASISGALSATTATFTNVSVGDGSASVPSITNTGDTNTGLFFPADDTIAFTEGGVEAMRIDSSGNVGIGTSSPAGKLQINVQDGFIFNAASSISTMRFGSAVTGEGTAELAYDRADGSVRISTGGTGGAFNERMRIDTSGNVGIGTGSPTEKLDVTGNIKASGSITAASASISGALTTATANITTATIGAIQGTSATLTNPLPIASGGTALTTLTAENVILGDGTNPVKFVAPSTTGNVLTSNGTTWTSAAAPAGGGKLLVDVFAASGTWTAPAGVTRVKVTVVAGGAGNSRTGCASADGGAGGVSQGVYTVTPATGYTVTIGAGSTGVSDSASSTAGTTSFGSTLISATGGTGANQAGPTNGTRGTSSLGNIFNSIARPASFSGETRLFGFMVFPWGEQNRTGSGGSPSAAVAWSTSSYWAPGAPGTGSIATGGVGGAVFVEYIAP
jgi:hypothetical protein